MKESSDHQSLEHELELLQLLRGEIETLGEVANEFKVVLGATCQGTIGATLG